MPEMPAEAMGLDGCSEGHSAYKVQVLCKHLKLSILCIVPME